jgi:hypothetical protein
MLGNASGTLLGRTAADADAKDNADANCAAGAAAAAVAFVRGMVWLCAVIQCVVWRLDE